MLPNLMKVVTALMMISGGQVRGATVKIDPIKSLSGAPLCALSTPAKTISMNEVIIGADTVSGPAKCAVHCQYLSGCVGFNVISNSQCQLFTSYAKLGKEKAGCSYYEVSGNTAGHTDVTGFTYDPTTKVYQLAIAEQVPVSAAQKKCASFGPMSHLPVFRTREDYDAAVNYIKNSGTTTVCKAGSNWRGYWTAIQRRTESCSADWIYNYNSAMYTNTVEPDLKGGKLSGLWISGEPNCYASKQFYIYMAIGQNYMMDDCCVASSGPQCIACQVFA